MRNIFQNLSSPLLVHEAHKFLWYVSQMYSEWGEALLSMQPYLWNEIVIEWNDAEWETPHVTRPGPLYMNSSRRYFREERTGPCTHGGDLVILSWYYSRSTLRLYIAAKYPRSRHIHADHSAKTSRSWANISMQLRLYCSRN